MAPFPLFAKPIEEFCYLLITLDLVKLSLDLVKISTNYRYSSTFYGKSCVPFLMEKIQASELNPLQLFVVISIASICESVIKEMF